MSAAHKRRPMHHQSDTVSAKHKGSPDLSGGHVKRIKEENEATSPSNDLWQRPVYVSSRDNADMRRTRL